MESNSKQLSNWVWVLTEFQIKSPRFFAGSDACTTQVKLTCQLSTIVTWSILVPIQQSSQRRRLIVFTRVKIGRIKVRREHLIITLNRHGIQRLLRITINNRRPTALALDHSAVKEIIAKTLVGLV